MVKSDGFIVKYNLTLVNGQIQAPAWLLGGFEMVVVVLEGVLCP